MKEFIRKYFLELFLAGYFIFLTLNLTKLPIFNDESIYLDWGIRSITVPGHLYYSLYDAKQPLLIWIFGIFEIVFSDPLFAGRLVSVLFGLLSVIFIYKLAKLMFGEKTAVASILFFAFTPIVFFYYRQALMEAAISSIGILSVYYFLKISNSKNAKLFLIPGIILGIGFFVKTTALIFLFTLAALLIYRFLKLKNLPHLKNLLYLFLGFSTSIILLLLNPEFWSTFSTNSRYTFTVVELLKFPVAQWAANVVSNLEILFIFGGPLLFCISTAGLILLWREKYKGLAFMILFPIILESLLTKNPSQRYLMPFVPLLFIPAGFFLVSYKKFIRKQKALSFILSFLFIFPSTYLLTLQIFAPQKYFKITDFSERTEDYYVKGNLSGYGVNELREYVDNDLEKKIILSFAENTGNPESALNVYYNDAENIKSSYLTSNYFSVDLSDYECIESSNKTPIYFVSRNNYMAGLERFLVEVKRIPLPESDEYIGVSKVISDCSTDKKLIVDLVRNL